MSIVASRVLPNRYLDSVVLMRLARSLSELVGVEDAAAMMGTDANKDVLAAGGFLEGNARSAGADDLVVAVRAESQHAADVALTELDALLTQSDRRETGPRAPRSLADAVAARPDLNLAVISVPGEYAAQQARFALEHGLHVFLFSSDVGLAEEVQLKQLAGERGLLCMGPDCGTAIIAGKGLGFANAVRRGPIGVVGASGTGIQVVTSLLDRFGVGVSHAIGCGSRDLGDAVGARTALAGLDALVVDPETEAILVVSKPPGAAAARRLRERAATGSKPVVFCFLGDAEGPATLDDASRAAASACGHNVPELEHALSTGTLSELRARLAPGQRFVRGLYAGGTLAYEAQLVLSKAGLAVASNAPPPHGLRLADASRSQGHTIVDLGAEEFTRGRPHPMIDARARRARLYAEASDPEVAVVLLDFVLGFGAAPDPVGDLAPDILAARSGAAEAGRELIVLASICGTERDPQGLEAQRAALRQAGAIVLDTNAAAARSAALLVAEPLATQTSPAELAGGRT